MEKHAWKDNASCLGMEVNDFFENYTKASLRVEFSHGS